MSKELIIYTDESEKIGTHFGNFYGGIVVRSEHLREVTSELSARKAKLGLTGEMKWSSTNTSVGERYVEMMRHLFDFVGRDRVKLRLMFTQNRHIPVGLTEYHKDNDYFLLYYQFVKHAFGLQYAGTFGQTTRVRLYLDELPHTRERASQFKSYLVALNKWPEFRRQGIEFSQDQIAEVKSHDHILLQCLDVVLGAIHFRLNDKHLEKPPGSAHRGRRTVAKEGLYTAVNQLIRATRPNFNIGISTGIDGNPANRWHHPYRHWLFVPSQHNVNHDAKKKK